MAVRSNSPASRFNPSSETAHVPPEKAVREETTRLYYADSTAQNVLMCVLYQIGTQMTWSSLSNQYTGYITLQHQRFQCCTLNSPTVQTVFQCRITGFPTMEHHTTEAVLVCLWAPNLGITAYFSCTCIILQVSKPYPKN